jgi:arylsulfatase A-like enzyme
LAGAIGGMAAGALDVALSWERAAAFLPAGRGRLVLFLCALYGAAGAIAGATTGLTAGALGWATDLGRLWRTAFEREEEADGARLAAYVVGIGAAAGGLFWLTRLVAADTLVRYHHRLLIAALVGAAAAGLTVAMAAGAFVIAALLSPILRFGPRVRAGFRASPAIEAFGWMLGLVTGATAVGAVLFVLEGRPRMPPPLRALNTALWTPTLIAGALTLFHFAARRLGRRWAPSGSKPASPALAVLAMVIALGGPVALGVAASWATVRQLDARPFYALGVALAITLLFSLTGLGRALGKLRPFSRFGFVIVPTALLLALAFSMGRSDRVRKSAISFTGLTGPLVRAIHTATDFDRDGYSSVLGGGDCNDLDRDVHPGAFDWPDDGVDQDCNGHQATLAAPPPRVYAAVPASVPEKPNVLLITIDALRADHVGSYGYRRPTTPNLDALARESVRFSNGWAHAPSTRYSVPAILTGRYPSTIAVNNDPRVHWPPQVLPENRLIGEILKDAGFHTGATLSYYYFEPGWGLNQGFDDYDYHLQTLHSMGGDPSKTQGTSARQLADLDVEYIAKHRTERFFLWTHFYDTHFGFEKHPDMPESDFGNDEIALYDGEIRFTDLHIGRVLDAVKAAGLWDNTIVIVTSDHGDGFGEHGLPQSQRHGYHLYRNETKVPMLIRVPGVPARVVDEPVGHIDLLPTLLNALRVPADKEPQLLGESVFGLMLGEPAPAPRKVFQEVWYEGPTSRKAVVDANWHLIRNLIPDDTVELYDFRTDVEEEHDLAGTGADGERPLSEALAAWMDAAALPADFKQKVEGNLSDKPLSFAAPLGDTLSDFLVLDGVDVKTPTLKAGGELEVVLVIHATKKPPDGWRFFTHVVGSDWRRLNADHDLVENLVPIARLKPGQYVRDRIRVPLPQYWPAGATTLEVGLWKSPARAKASGPHASGDFVRAASVQVVR